MTEENTATYGYEDDESGQNGSSLNFGLNAGVTNMTKFEFNANAGKDGAEQEALDIVFTINGKPVSYRMFPVTKAFGKNQEEITNPKAPEMIKAMKEFNAVIAHILGAFVSKETIKASFSVPITSFKSFANIATNILPKDFTTKTLDVFAQWQWQITGDNTKTYLRLPKNMKHGKWICPHIVPAGGEWIPNKLNGALSYVDAEGKKHLFTRQKWFMTSNFAEQQADDEGLEDIDVNHTAAPGEEGAPAWEETT